MNIKTFKNELNPMFIDKAKKIYLLARTNGNTLEVNNNVYSFKSDYESKVRLDNKLNIISTECNCKSKYLYCEHTVATLFAIEEFLLKKVVSNTSLNDNDIYSFIDELNSLNNRAYNYIYDDLLKVFNNVSKLNKYQKYIDYFVKRCFEVFSYNVSLIIDNFSKYISRMESSLLISLLKGFINNNIKINGFIKELFLNGMNNKQIKDMYEELYLNISLELLEDDSLLDYPAFLNIIYSMSSSSLPYLYLKVYEMIKNRTINYIYVQNFFNHLNTLSEFNTYEKIVAYIFKYDTEIMYSYEEKLKLLNVLIKFKYRLDEGLINYNFNEDDISLILTDTSLSNVNSNFKFFSGYYSLVIKYINNLYNNEINPSLYGKYDANKEMMNLLYNLRNLTIIFDIDFKENAKDIYFFLLNNVNFKEDFKLYSIDKDYIHFSSKNATIYYFSYLNKEYTLKKYNYMLEPINKYEKEEIKIPDYLESEYEDFLDSISYMIPDIIKQKKIKKLNSLQEYLLSSFIVNEDKYNLEVKFDLNTKKRFIKKELIGLRLKVGTNKFYYVNNFYDFFNAFKNEESLDFGKNIFNLNVNNFSEDAKKIMSLIVNEKNISEDKKELLLDTNSVSTLLDNIKGFITFKYNSNKYSLRLSSEVISPLIEIDENGVIKSNELNDNSLIISSLANDYLLDLNKLVVNKLSYKNDKIKNTIYFLIKNNNKFETNDIMDKFNELVYPLIHDISKISNEYKEKNPLKLMEIKCFLDINEDNVISVNSRFFIDETELFTLDDIQKEKVNNYNKLLSLYGFDDEGLIKDSDLVGEFLKKDLSSLKELAKVYISEDLDKKKITTFNSFNVYLRQNNNMLNIAFESSQFSDDELYAILKAYKKKKKFAFLKGKVIELDEKTVNELANIVEDFNLDEKNLSKEVNNPLFNLLKVSNYYSLSSFEIEDKLGSILSDLKDYKEADFKVNDELSRIMRPYQIEAFKWLKTLNKYNLGGVLADDMGLGKTIETIALLDSVESSFPSIIISPKSLIYNWEKELNKWPTKLTPIVISGNKVERKKLLKNNYKENNVYIISYDTLRNDLDEFNEYTFNYAILDEAQAIKNMQALKTKSVKRITSLNKLVLTGTPIENSVADLWSIFDFLMPSYLFNYDRFRLEIEKGVLMNDDEAYNRLIIKTKPFILRRKKNDVLKDLPDKVEETISISMSKEQRMIYDAYLLQTRKALNQDASNNKIMVLSMLTRLRQICISPSLVVDNDLESEKINYCLDMVDNLINTDHKVLIFSQFVSALDIIQNELSKRGIEYFIITGDTNSKRRLEMCDEFNKESSKEKVFLISLKAGGTGLNLVGADTVIHLDPWWNVAIENQASDRAHRIGQERKVTVFKLIMNNSIEEKVIELQKNKKEIADRIISNNDTDISNLSFNDYDYLLS